MDFIFGVIVGAVAGAVGIFFIMRNNLKKFKEIVDVAGKGEINKELFMKITEIINKKG